MTVAAYAKTTATNAQPTAASGTVSISLANPSVCSGLSFPRYARHYLQTDVRSPIDQSRLGRSQVIYFAAAPSGSTISGVLGSAGTQPFAVSSGDIIDFDDVGLPVLAIGTGDSVNYPSDTLWGAAERLHIRAGTASSPVVERAADHLTLPNVLIERYVRVGSGADGGGLSIKVEAELGGGLQANGLQVFMVNKGSQDMLSFGSRSDLQGPGGAFFGHYVQTNNNPQTVLISNGGGVNDAVVTLANHDFQTGAGIKFTGTSAPTGMAFDTQYYVLAAGKTTDTFKFALTPGGTPIITSTAGTGPFKVTGNVMWGFVSFQENISGVHLDDSQGQGPWATDLLSQPAGTHRTGAVIHVLSGGAAKKAYGMLVEASSIGTAVLYDRGSGAPTVIDITGSHSIAGVRITNNDASYTNRWKRTSATAAEYGLAILSDGSLALDDVTNGARKLTVPLGTPGANNVALFVQYGATPSHAQVKYFDDGSGHLVLYLTP